MSDALTVKDLESMYRGVAEHLHNEPYIEVVSPLTNLAVLMESHTRLYDQSLKLRECCPDGIWSTDKCNGDNCQSVCVQETFE